MDLFDFLGLLFLALVGWLWYDSLNVREAAVVAAKAACHSENLLLLDDTVAILKISLERDSEGVMCLRRVYGFEFSDTGNDRSSGSLVLLGNCVLVINLNLPETQEPKILH
ncbi:MAG: DUF3301 domain-containing protein [Betaproteobacteria bacterium]